MYYTYETGESGHDIIRKAFAALTPAQRKRLRWHAEQGTPVLCGEFSELYHYSEDTDAPPGGA